MREITLIPIEELLTDMCAAAFDMGTTKVALSIGVEIAEGQPVQERYDKNEKQVETIRKEILRRLK